jgi:hypothetical protein
MQPRVAPDTNPRGSRAPPTGLLVAASVLSLVVAFVLLGGASGIGTAGCIDHSAPYQGLRRQGGGVTFFFLPPLDTSSHTSQPRFNPLETHF